MTSIKRMFPRELASYESAKTRCTNPRRADYERYGEKGVKFLFKDFYDFYHHIGPRPEGMTLDRIDSSGHYEHGNVKWSTPAEQSRNRRNVILYEMDGKKQHLRAWAKEYGIKRQTLEHRIKKLGMPLRDALTFPVSLANDQIVKAAALTSFYEKTFP